MFEMISCSNTERVGLHSSLYIIQYVDLNENMPITILRELILMNIHQDAANYFPGD